MPYGTPTFNEQGATYQVSFTHDNGTNMSMTAGGMFGQDIGEFDAAVQAFQDLINGSAEFNLNGSGAKTYQANVEITPTP